MGAAWGLLGYFFRYVYSEPDGVYFVFFLSIHYSHTAYLDHGDEHTPDPVHRPTRRQLGVASPSLRPGLPPNT